MLTRERLAQPLSCDDCNSIIKKGEPAYSCVMCDHDRCSACAGEPRSSPAQPNEPKRETIEDSKLRSPVAAAGSPSAGGFAGALDAAAAAQEPARPPTPPTPKPAAPTAHCSVGAWAVGVACEARYKAQSLPAWQANKWYAGKIASAPDDEGRCDVAFDDGDFEAAVAPPRGTLDSPSARA